MSTKKAALWVISFLLPVQVSAEDLNDFLRAATEVNRPDVPLRADGEIVVRSPEGATTEKIIIALQTDGGLYLETKSGTRALLKPPEREFWVRESGAGSKKKVALEDAFGKTDFTWEDVLPFDLASWEFPVIIDKSPHQITVQLTPKTKQYILVVATFDREMQVPVKTLYYVEKASNLVKMRTDEDFVEVAGQWLPGKITMKTFAMRTETVVTLKWSKATDLPEELFSSASLDGESGLRFPE